MDKAILEQYVDACKLIEETEEDIQQIKKQRRTVVHDVVKGSSSDFPYTPQNFHIEGISYSAVQDLEEPNEEERCLQEIKANAKSIKVQVEKWMITVPMRMQRIIRFKFFENLTWAQVAMRMGRGLTEEGVKKEFQRFMMEK